jgi:hypothetical protein
MRYVNSDQGQQTQKSDGLARHMAHRKTERDTNAVVRIALECAVGPAWQLQGNLDNLIAKACSKRRALLKSKTLVPPNARWVSVTRVHKANGGFTNLRRFLECVYAWLVNSDVAWARTVEYLVHHIGGLTEQCLETWPEGSVPTVDVNLFPELVHSPHPQIMGCLDEIMRIRAEKRVTANQKNIHTLLPEPSEGVFHWLATLKVTRSQVAYNITHICVL